MNFNDIVLKAQDGQVLNKEELIKLLSYEPNSMESYQTMALGQQISRAITGNQAEIHGQFAFNVGPCPKECKFCSFAVGNQFFHKYKELSIEEAVESALRLEAQGVNSVLGMSTATYPFAKLIETTQEIRKALKPETLFVANVSDKSLQEAQRMKDAGIHGVFHGVRMREGEDTLIDPKTRIESIRNFQEAGIVVGTCIEPVGPEHSNEEIADKIEFCASIHPAYSGVARRINLPGTKINKRGMISELRMSQLVAISILGTPRTVKGYCTHEPCSLGAAAGANLMWAEIGANPRDTSEHTEEHRGKDFNVVKAIYHETHWEVLEGPSRFYRS